MDSINMIVKINRSFNSYKGFIEILDFVLGQKVDDYSFNSYKGFIEIVSEKLLINVSVAFQFL